MSSDHLSGKRRQDLDSGSSGDTPAEAKKKRHLISDNKTRNGGEEKDLNWQNRRDERGERNRHSNGGRDVMDKERRGRPENEERKGTQNRPSWENKRVRQHAEKILERKLLWKGKVAIDEDATKQERDEAGSSSAQSSGTVVDNNIRKLENKWQSMIAATAKDTQQMDKFQRLMGLKKTAVPPASKPGDEINDEGKEAGKEMDKEAMERERRRQCELQQNLSAQFEMARHVHHSARGRGLGSL